MEHTSHRMPHAIVSNLNNSYNTRLLLLLLNLFLLHHLLHKYLHKLHSLLHQLMYNLNLNLPIHAKISANIFACSIRAKLLLECSTTKSDAELGSESSVELSAKDEKMWNDSFASSCSSVGRKNISKEENLQKRKESQKQREKAGLSVIRTPQDAPGITEALMVSGDMLK